MINFAKKKRVYFVTVGVLLLFAFQNCSRAPESEIRGEETQTQDTQVTQDTTSKDSSDPQSKAASGSVKGTTVLFSGFKQLYSPAMLDSTTMLMGGWATEADFQAKDDRLYRSNLVDGVWQYPTPLLWTNAGFTPGYVKDFHTNDPTIVYRPDVKWHYMYYTMLSNEFTSFEDITTHNWVGFASSADNGNTWTHHAVVIGQDNGYDQRGAWSPSALKVKQEIWIYYHNNRAQVLRTRMKLNGWEKIKTEPVVDLAGNPIALINVDVQYAFGKYWLMGGSDLKHLSLMLSDNGIHFYPYDGQAGVLMGGGTNGVITPHMQILSATKFNVLFGYCQGTGTAADGVGSCSSMHQWSYELTTQPQSPSVLKGQIDGLITEQGRNYIVGWACSSKLQYSTTVHFYAGGSYGRGGQIVGGFKANLQSEQAVSEACEDPSQSPHRFKILINPSMKSRFANKSIFIYAISPVGAMPLLLNGSGNFRIPAN